MADGGPDDATAYESVHSKLLGAAGIMTAAAHRLT